MFISHNALALNAKNQLLKGSKAASGNTEKLSSGQRINRASDDAAGLSISEKMRAQIRALHQGSRNCQDGVSLVQTADGALNEVSDGLVRMKELAVQAANGTLSGSDKQAIQAEISALNRIIDDIAIHTQFNGKNLLGGTPTMASIDVSIGGMNKTFNDGDIPLGEYGAVVRLNPGQSVGEDEAYDFYIDWENGLPVSFNISRRPSGLLVTQPLTPGTTYSVNGITFDISKAFEAGANGNQYQGTVVFHPGVNEKVDGAKEIIIQYGDQASQNLIIELPDARTSTLGISTISLLTHEGAVAALGQIDKAISIVSGYRSRFGAYQNQIEHIMNNNKVYYENLTAAESRVRDADIAKQMLDLTKNDILMNSGQAMLALANAMPKRVLSLLE